MFHNSNAQILRFAPFSERHSLFTTFSIKQRNSVGSVLLRSANEVADLETLDDATTCQESH